MRLLKASLLFILLPLSMGLRAQAQAPGRYEKDGLSFDYPAGWTLAEGGDARLQSVSLTRPGLSAFITVFASRERITAPTQLGAAFSGITVPYVEKIARSLGLDKPPAPGESECLDVGGRKAGGFRMEGRVKGEPTTAEVYTVVLGRRLLHLVRVGHAADAAQSDDAWKSLLGTLKVEAPPAASPDEEAIDRIVSGGVLNGRALKKPQPDYPSAGKMARASGTVVVQITVDEKGDVVSAAAVSGHPVLRKASEEAARRATFTPTKLCGQPVKVTGVVSYNFILN